MMFDHTSRYYNIETAEYSPTPGKAGATNGRKIAYKRRRFLPRAKTFTLLKEVKVVDGDRLDRVTYNELGDPEQFWQVCDANDALNPFDLTAEIGASLRIPLPQA